MKTVLLRGPALTQSGYGVHTRQVARWLLTKNVKLQVGALPWGATPWLLNDDNSTGNIISKMMSLTNPHPSKPDVSFQVQLPNEWDPTVANYNVGVTASVETDKCNPVWIDSCNKMNAIVVPSEHAKRSLTNTGNILVPIHVIPESFHDDVAKEDLQPLNVDFSTPFNFLIFGQLTGNNPYNDRKNIHFTIKWLCEEFKNDPNVGIVIKTNASRNTKIDRNNVYDLITKLLHETRKGQFPRVHVLHGQMNESEVASLYRHEKIKGIVSLTRGEGFGLPTLEAAASGLPVIATSWSGHMDYLNQGKFVGVLYDLKQIHQSRVDNTIFMPNARWAEASEVDFKKRVRKFYESSRVPKEWALDLQKKLHKSHNFSSIASEYSKVFDEILSS